MAKSMGIKAPKAPGMAPKGGHGVGKISPSNAGRDRQHLGSTTYQDSPRDWTAHNGGGSPTDNQPTTPLHPKRMQGAGGGSYCIL